MPLYIEENLVTPFQFLFQELSRKNQELEIENQDKEWKRRQLEEERDQKENLIREIHHRKQYEEGTIYRSTFDKG